MLREMAEKGHANSTQEIEVGVGMPEKGVGKEKEKEKGTGTGTVEAWLVGCSCRARLRRFGKEQAELE